MHQKSKKNLYKSYQGNFGFLVCILFLLTSCQITNQPEPISFESEPYFFDVGAAEAELSDDAIPLTPSWTYSEENGYGWLSQNSGESFFHEGWEPSRDAFLIDGISGTELKFKADIPKGEWWVTVWFEAGLEDSSTAVVMANGENITPELQTFTPNSEERESIQKIYRVIQRKVVIEDDGLQLDFIGNEDAFRLLGFSMIPSSEPKGAAAEVFAKLENAGVYDSERELEPLVQELDELAQQEEYENFATFWKLQLQILQKAEKYFWYRGWSKYTEKTELGLFDHLHQTVMLYDGLLNYSGAEENPLYERELWYRGRLLYWLWLERGIHYEKDAAERDLAKMLELHPQDEMVRMYNGEQIDNEDPFDGINKPTNAPDWAFAQWEVTNRLKHIADWWVLEQQDERGEFGGKYGDDVEILRFWSPLILSGDSVVYEGWKKLADGVWNSSKVYKGYAKNPSDVEHSSEFISDTAPLMVLYNDDDRYEERLSYSADYFKNLWTGFNDNNHRFFKSSWFSSTEIEMEPPKNRDVPYTTRAAKAVRYYAWKTQDASTLKALEEWADGWLAVSQQTDKGKPVGIIPASIAFPSGEFNGSEDNWYTANMYWDYFDWSGGSAILDQLLFTWTMTGNDKYLTPFIQHLDLVSKYSGDLNSSQNQFEEGSEGWAAHQLGNSDGFWNVVGTWRLLTGNNKYDKLIIEHGTPFIKYRLTGNTGFLVEGIQPYLETIRYNYPLFTTEAIHTDRIHIGPGNAREIGIVQGMVTGYGIAESSSPYIAVSWEDASRDITYLVTDSDSTRLDAELFSFSEKNEGLTMRSWQLSKGSYKLELTSEGETIESRDITVNKGGDRFRLELPSKQLVKISIQQTSK
ncbi:MAG: hypothetical protein CL670_14990 [Balneola sp.]|nr:hypothetical protein [Balneola sp.]|tara:strand:- start:12647 stop:15232 length:2586 start_codon:yes stop_codon:yes gene_type:complete